MKYYKVVTHKLKSFASTPCEVQYIHNEWVKPVLENSLLYVFTDKEFADLFLELHFFPIPMQIWECDVDGIVAELPLIYTPCITMDMEHYEDMLEMWWEEYIEYIKTVEPHPLLKLPFPSKIAPGGTKLVEKVRLTKWVCTIKENMKDFI